MSRTIAIVGGTGAEGFALAQRFAHAGARVIIGSRDQKKAEEAAARLAGVQGLQNVDAARDAEIVILTVPLAAQISILKSIRASLRPGAILVDATVPLEAAIGGAGACSLRLRAGCAGAARPLHAFGREARRRAVSLACARTRAP